MSSETPFTETGVTAQEFTEFDYVVVGGGTAGLVIAARLSEDPSVTVGVIEAGLWRPNDPKIDYPAYIGRATMDPDYDWCLETEPQIHSNGRKYTWPRGKVLGGSSAINFLVYQRGYSKEYDDVGKLGNKGWSWEDIASFFRKSSTLTKPSTDFHKRNLAVCDEVVHGTDGPLRTSFSPWFTEAQRPWYEVFKSLGLSNAPDGLNGNNVGFWTSPATINAENYSRSYSASAYYAPNADRPNLKVLTGALASKIVFADHKAENGDLIASGVQFIVQGKSYIVKAKKEVVVSAGTVKSPHLLELSGIGKADILRSAGVEPLVELDVGENLQDHMYCTTAYKLKPGFFSWDNLRQEDFAKTALEQYHAGGEDPGVIASAFSGFAYFPLKQYLSPEEISQVKESVNSIDFSKYSKGVQEGIKMQLARLDDENCPFMEHIFAPGYFAVASTPLEGQVYFSVLSGLQQPFSRGNIHLVSSDPAEPPKINPNYFSVDADLQILSKAVKYADEMVEKDPLRQHIVARQDPDPAKYSTEEDYREFAKDYTVTEYHPIGTCSMMPRDKGGVVNERLRLYGTSNVRVADVSILPLHVSSHTVGVAYAIGEKAAHMIKEDAQSQL